MGHVTATATRDNTPLEMALTYALQEHTGDPDIAAIELPDAIPRAPPINPEAGP